MVFHTCAGTVAGKPLADRHIFGCGRHPVDTGRHRIERVAVPDQIHFRDNLSRMWFDDRHDPFGQRPVGNRGRDASICTAFFSGSGHNGGRNFIAGRLS